jgi:hypothetical protein
MVTEDEVNHLLDGGERTLDRTTTQDGQDCAGSGGCGQGYEGEDGRQVVDQIREQRGKCGNIQQGDARTL